MLYTYIYIYLERKNHWTHISLLQTCFIDIAAQSSDKHASEKHWRNISNIQRCRTKKKNIHLCESFTLCLRAATCFCVCSD